MMDTTRAIELSGLERSFPRFWALSGEKVLRLDREYDAGQGSPVFTRNGKYTVRGWTEWTEGFVYGSALLQYDATGGDEFLRIGRENTVARMAKHVSHIGVHDHGFNNVSTYGSLLRLMADGRIPADPWERRFYELALKVSGAVQAARWTEAASGNGFIYSFNGPHSLFADTIRSLRSPAIAHLLGHALMGENDRRVDLLERLIRHARTTALYIVYYGEGRDSYDLRGRVVHEAIFNTNDGAFRCPSTQQGYSPFSTWTRGLAWIVTGFAEQLEFVASLPGDLPAFDIFAGKPAVLAMMEKAACAAADFYLEHTPADGIPYWDTGAPGLAKMGDCLARPADPFNDHEPVDSSAAAIAAQGLIRLGLRLNGAAPGVGGRSDVAGAAAAADGRPGDRFIRAGLSVVGTLIREPYLSTDPGHQGLLLHSVYHRPNGWDLVPEGRKAPCGESCMWGDYHVREAALYAQRLLENEPYYAFWRIA